MKKLITLSVCMFMTAMVFAQPKAIEVAVHGKGKLILFLPGFACAGSVWNETVNNLSPGFQAHFVTYAGFNYVSPIPMPWYPALKDALQHNEKLIQYTIFRKWMHGPVTYTTMGLYTPGYYFIMVQFSELVLGWLIILTCVAYPIVAYLIIVQVHKGIKNEMEQLRWLADCKKEMEE